MLRKILRMPIGRAHAVDPAILDALGLGPAQNARLAPIGHSGFTSTYKLSCSPPAEEARSPSSSYFVKIAAGDAARVMFRGEHASLNAIHAVVPDLCPQSYAHGPLASQPGKSFLATDFLDLGAAGRSSSSISSGASLAAKLARLHTTPAPVPEGFDRPMFGFPVPTCCGDTEQDNSWRACWADFFADNRLRAIVRRVLRDQGPDDDLVRCVERVADKVVPRLVGPNTMRITPVVVHGDLWSGNHARGRIGSSAGETGELVFDPSCVYGHSEYELGIMRMFGGFGGSFWREYGELVPRAAPAEEWDDRVLLYELYHHLNHYAIFGSGYRGGAMAIMKKLLTKYGGD